MKLWGGRFTKETNQLVHNFNESLSFDQKSYRQGIRDSITHVEMLVERRILTEQDRDNIIHELGSILEDLDNGKLTISSDSGYENTHSFVEGTLTKRIEETGKHLHTGRNRSDQVALGMKFYTRGEISAIETLVKELLEELLTAMEENTDAFMSGFTHLQKAQPITLTHHMGTYFETFSGDRSHLRDIHRRMNYCPLGSGALAGATYPPGQEYTVEPLGFDGPALNFMDSMADRDYLIEFLGVLSTISIRLSRFYEEIIIWNTNEYRFMEIGDSYNTGSSVMPQKKSPDIAELMRGESGRVYGALVSMLITMKGIPLTYNKDIQEDKEFTSDAIDTVRGCLAPFTDMISSMNFRKEVMEAGAKNGFTNTTDTADYLVNKGVSFGDARGIVEQLVFACISRGIALDDFSLKEYKAVSLVSEGDVYETISMKTCVEKRLTIRAPGQEAMKRAIGIYKKQLGMDDVQ